MLPEGFRQRITTQKYIDSGGLFTALEDTSPVSIRINPNKWSYKPQNAEQVIWCSTGYYLDRRPSFTLDPLFHSGCYYPQEASGMFLEHVIRQSAGSLENIRVLDLCGAPGGKSSHLSEIIGPGSLLVANEVIRSRAAILAETITKWGTGNTLVTQNDPSAFAYLPGYFDIIVVDAPCSGEGMFRNPVAINEWSVDNTALCSERQKRLLMDVWPSLKENGLLIYSTCTFNPGENEENLKWLIEKNEAECIRINISDFPGITEIDFKGIYGYGFYPGKVKGEGFFISAIRKKGRQADLNIRSERRSELKPGKNDISVVSTLINFSNDRLLKWGDELFVTPCNPDDYFYLFKKLKIVKAGTKIALVKRDSYLPSHDLALSKNLKELVFPVAEIDLDQAISYLRRDNFTLSDMPEGWILIRYKKVNLGFIKNIGKRINNYFPVEWRIRMDKPESGKENILSWQHGPKHK